MTAIESGDFISLRGVRVTVKRIPQPDCPRNSQQIQVQYRGKIRPGLVVWFPDVPRCEPSIRRVLDHYQHDRDNLGQEIPQASERVLATLENARQGRSLQRSCGERGSTPTDILMEEIGEASLAGQPT